VCVRVHGKGVNSTLQFNPLVTKHPLTEGVGVGLMVLLDSRVCEVEVKEVLEEGRE